jgi:hypothetical protein
VGVFSKRGLAEIAAMMAERRERERVQREERGRIASLPKEVRPATAKELVSAEARSHGKYEDTFMPDLAVQNQGKPRMVKVVRNAHSSTVDKWLAEGGMGFEEPQRRAVEHVRGLWAQLNTGRKLVANYVGAGGGGGDAEGEIFARLQLAEYEDEIPRSYWMIFENCCRFDMPAGRAGSHLANNDPQRIASARTVVGFVASKIAEWRKY